MTWLGNLLRSLLPKPVPIPRPPPLVPSPTVGALVIDGKSVPVPHRIVTSYRDDPRISLKTPEDGRAHRAHPVQLIVVHTTKGIPGGRDKRPQVIRPGYGPNLGAELRVAKFWSSSDLQSGAHLVVDFDGSIGCLTDLATTVAYHAKAMNARSVGIEIYQGGDAELYAGQLEATADLIDVLTSHFGIQRQIPDRYRGPLPRLQRGGDDFYGVVGHRDGDDNRGLGDPGDAIFDVLARRGYERYNLAAGADLLMWKERQRNLDGRLTVDGIPGPATVRALRAAGYRHGLIAAGRF